MADHEASGGTPPEPLRNATPAETPDRDQGLERMVFFSDAVIAIAMTLLALELPIPGVGVTHKTNSALWNDLAGHWGDDYFPFLLSFVVIASFWLSHHRFFRRVARAGSVLIRLNLLFLLMIVLLPFVTRVLGVDSDFTIGPVLYASVVSVTCFVLGSMAIVAGKQRLLHQTESTTTASAMAGGLFASGAVFLVSIPIAFWSTSVALYSWLVLSVLLHYAGALAAKLRKQPNPLTTDRWDT